MKKKISDKILFIEELLKPFLSENKEVTFETKEDLINIFKDLFLDKKPCPFLDLFEKRPALTGFLGVIISAIIVALISAIIVALISAIFSKIF